MITTKPSAGFSLVEVAVALAISSLGIVTMLALFPAVLDSNKASDGENAANSILANVSTDLRATPPSAPPGGAATSQEYSLAIPAAGASSTDSLYFGADGTFSKTLNSSSRYRLTITFLSSSGGMAASTAVIKVSWPAASVNGLGSAESFVALDRN